MSTLKNFLLGEFGTMPDGVRDGKARNSKDRVHLKKTRGGRMTLAVEHWKDLKKLIGEMTDEERHEWILRIARL